MPKHKYTFLRDIRWPALTLPELQPCHSTVTSFTYIGHVPLVPLGCSLTEHVTVTNFVGVDPLCLQTATKVSSAIGHVALPCLCLSVCNCTYCADVHLFQICQGQRSVPHLKTIRSAHTSQTSWNLGVKRPWAQYRSPLIYMPVAAAYFFGCKSVNITAYMYMYSNISFFSNAFLPTFAA